MPTALIIHPPQIRVRWDGTGNLDLVVTCHNHPADGLTLRLPRHVLKDFKKALVDARLWNQQTSFDIGEGVKLLVLACEMPYQGKPVRGVELKIISDNHPWKELPFRFIAAAIMTLEKSIAEKGGLS